MLSRHLSALVTMLVIGAGSASAQTAILRDPATTTLKTARPVLVATSSFAPGSFGGTFNGSPVMIGLAWVSLSNSTDPVVLGQYKESGVLVQTPQGIANGIYSVEFTIPWANAAATVSVMRGTTEIAQCPIQQQLSYAAGSLIQRCDSGPVSVSDGNLNLLIQIKDPNPSCLTCRSAQQLSVSKVTINLWR